MKQFQKYLQNLKEAKSFKDYLYQLYYSDGISQANGFNTLDEAINYAFNRKIKTFSIFIS